MGRSQVKFRATHGRGRGRGGPGATAGTADARNVSSHGGGGRRPLESNAFRYADDRGDDVNDDDGEQQQALAHDNKPLDARTYAFRRQFFAGEENVRDVGATSSSAYFQSQTMKQWDDNDNDVDAKSTAGVLDFHWLGEQLAMVAPSVRYQMDPKYCSDFDFEPIDRQDDDVDGEEHKALATDDAAVDAATAAASSQVTRSSTVVQPNAMNPQTSTNVDSELDLLLQLSSNASQPAPSTAATAASSATTRNPQAPLQPAYNSAQDQLEDWLDDVLDM